MSPNSEATQPLFTGVVDHLCGFLHADDLGKACIFALEHWSIQGSNIPTMNRDSPYLS